MSLGDRVASLRRVAGRSEVRSISRRYFVANTFDGTLTGIGVVVGAYLSGVAEGFVVVGIGLGAAVGLGTSGVWSVWEIERAETRRKRQELEGAMLTDLGDTQLSRDHRSEQLLHAIASATGPVIGVTVTIVPFLLEGVVLSMRQGVFASVGIGVLLLAAIGAYMGAVSKQRWYVAAVRMGLAGIVVALLNVLLPG
ncbi:VIT1/CCC1 transporter family protein [Natrialbaceae archaeon AArc-T1-2]|uniref:VIT1/CCC1 transporter family protein n=1 Tax=Natrialbaceae archaeon AArc-T1-2 TaxID=3053904 RepID=UPI00255AF145|nr:VIT1/CCC1 transporter family protein [Natrialbaceae archaeon AArc-T1-2]WIV68513.1 VIT1/CCC1 transporter family protein [Natrialbaceae archaeon AArc-T1-2]